MNYVNDEKTLANFADNNKMINFIHLTNVIDIDLYLSYLYMTFVTFLEFHRFDSSFGIKRTTVILLIHITFYKIIRFSYASV